MSERLAGRKGDIDRDSRHRDRGAHYKRGTKNPRIFLLRFFCSKNLEGGTMEQPKISVTFDGEIDITALDEVFFTTLLNRITEIRREQQNTQTQETKND